MNEELTGFGESSNIAIDPQKWDVAEEICAMVNTHDMLYIHQYLTKIKKEGLAKMFARTPTSDQYKALYYLIIADYSNSLQTMSVTDFLCIDPVVATDLDWLSRSCIVFVNKW